MVNALGKMPFSKPMGTHRSDTTGVLASRNTNIFASAGLLASAGIFGNSSGSAETSGSCACGSSGGGGNTLAIA